ncbi:hypothetical protein [Thiolapillus sp.]|uniref:hypothetical protein n=1 Tax=Thiolapillus sp. TaxID=2017437 RepID=UPI003AF6C91F
MKNDELKTEILPPVTDLGQWLEHSVEIGAEDTDAYLSHKATCLVDELASDGGVATYGQMRDVLETLRENAREG